ncbi:MAG: TonB-dependent receptor [Bacteroidales bacterium]|nr:TonB-dependent receptor [Bacteroidales bacterium]
MNKHLVLVLVLVAFGSNSFAQFGQAKGFVVDESNGNPIVQATVLIKDSYRGVATDENGYFMIQKIPEGKIQLCVRFVTYEEKCISLVIESEGTSQVLVQLTPRTIELGEAIISGTRRLWETTNEVAMHKLTPTTINKIPSLTGIPDLGDILQVLPGIIFTGDQGGQFYVRGGAPVHNLVKLDGMTVIKPFHSIGFVSVFDTETIASVDVYTAGFGAEYGGRLSSVIDIRTRPGNRRQFKGTVNMTNFGYGLTLDVPIIKMTKEKPGSVSLLLSNKRSYIDKVDNVIYPYLDEVGIPYQYNDFFVKVSLMDASGDQLDILGTRISDRSWVGETMHSDWLNTAGGVKFITSPNSSKWLYKASSYYSVYSGEFIEVEERPRKTYFSTFENSMNIFRMGEVADWDIGLSLNTYNSIHSFQGIDGIIVEREYFTTELIAYLANKTRIGKWLIEPGMHLAYYADQTFISPEPRLKVKYNLSKTVSLSMASGLYSQNLMSATSDRDVVSLFEGYYMGPHLVQDFFHGKQVINKIQQAWHFVGGINILTKKDVKFTVEGYIKNFTKLVSYNRNRIYRDSYLTWQVPEYLKSFFLLEQGKAYGVDFLADYTRDNFSLWIGYSLAWVFREDEMLKYVPHYDRRHNLNLITGYKFGKHKNWNFKTRWNIGSGFPFTQTNGAYEDFSFIYGSFLMDKEANGDLLAWFGELNKGRLPWYHRLDVGVYRQFDFAHNQKLEVSLVIINAYNRRNMFYINRMNYKRVDQFPILPNLSIKYRW